jgi:ribosomal protein S18 acetylase RimI-like enzyme
MTPAVPVQVRPFQPGGRDPVLALAPRLAEGVAAWRDPEAVLRAARGWVSDAVAADGQPGHAVYVATSGDRVVGVLGISEQRHWTGQAEAYIGELAVAPGMERRGIATALMTAARAWAGDRRLGYLTLETGAANHGARAFYAALGFQDEQVRLTRPARPELPG